MSADNTAVREAGPTGKTGTETVISSTDAMDCFGDVIDRAYMGERFQITRYGRDRAFILGPREYEEFVQLKREAAKRKR